ncbi:DUF4955 domain-containing protein [Polaribacter aquimarinus]|uniref:Por secretion system C-terminal sorting domain-containing protein n=1 Tax=Polaribacter aquimarinus TaxID=2100726 RepID=A0A2U2J8N3_9FLAO|nr:DUF4955 domain-containing protein [Polaribacter aquimarinus]PWG04699.1 hypothetical protein DIS07_12215 [Polaribacter aquimarinus]
MSLRITHPIVFVLLFIMSNNIQSQNPSTLYQNWVNAQVNSTTPILPTFSYAGYYNGEIGLPSSFTQTVYDVTQSPFNAVPNDNKSDKEAIKAAIAAAEANPNGGIIFFPPGRFIVHDTNPEESGVAADNGFEVIRISKSNIVIKGSGSGVGGTELYQKSYTDHVDKATKDYVCPYMILFWNGEDSANTFITNVTGNSDRETHTVTVASTTNIAVGQWVELYVKNTDSNFVNEELSPHTTADFYQPNSLKIVNDGVEVREIHKVVSKTATTITFKEPIHRAVNAAYGWKINNFKALEGVGVQDLKYTGGFIWDHIHHRAPQEADQYPGEAVGGPHAFLSSSGWSGIQFNHVVNGWITNVEFSNMSQVAQFKFSAYSTALSNTYTGNPGHNFITTNSATGCLIGKNIDNTTGVWHSCGVNALSIGNVLWRNESPQNGESGTEIHASQPRSTLVDVSKGGFFFNQGGATGSLPNHLKNLVLWNFEGVSYQSTDVKSFRPNSETRYAKFIMPIISGLKGFTMSTDANQYQVNESQGTHVDETSLYESQLAYRLGALPNWITGAVTETPLTKRTIYFEDFRYANTGRGFEIKTVNLGGQTSGNVFKRINDIVGVSYGNANEDSNNLFDVNTDRELNRIPNGTPLAVSGSNPTSLRALAVVGNNGTDNFGIDSYAVFTTLDLTSSNGLIGADDDYIYASFWSQLRYGKDAGANISLKVSTDYSGDVATATWSPIPLHSGKFGNEVDHLKYVKGIVDLSSYNNSTTVTLALHYVGNAADGDANQVNGTFYFSDLKFTAQNKPLSNTWDGSTDSNFSEPANWDTKAAPVGNANNIAIPAGLTNYPTLTSGTNLNVNSISIASGATFKADGSATVTGNVTYNRNLSYMAGNGEGWHLVGSPVSGQVYNNAFATTNSIASAGTKRGIATHNNESLTNHWSYLENNDSNSGTFGVGTGYSIKTSKTTDISFTGSLNTNEVNKGITIGAGSAYNLISNPFTTFINSGAFLSLTENSNKLTSQTIWIWNPTSKNYESKITLNAFKVAPGQAFFVKCAVAGDLKFKEEIQSHQNSDTFLKSKAIPEIQLNITDGNLERFTKVFYLENATRGFDNGYDGETFAGASNSLDVFTQLLENNQGVNYQIQSLPNSDLESMVLPVGVIAGNGKEITFSVQALNLPQGIKVFLEDKLTNTITRLDETNASYKITLSESINGIGRFFLHTKPSFTLSSVDDLLKDISVFKVNNHTLRIVGLQSGNANVKMFNVFGQKMMDLNFKNKNVKDIFIPKLSKGVYVVKVSSKYGKMNKKIILK